VRAAREARVRTLSLAELNRATLARQLLLERRRIAPAAAVERIGGMQAQSGRAPYIGLWSRTVDFGRPALERALARRRLVRATLMRGTIHLVSAADYALFAAALDVAPPSWIEPDAHALADRVAGEVRALAHEPVTREEVFAWLEREHGVDAASLRGLWYALRIHGAIVHAPATGRWRQPSSTTYVAVEREEHDPLRARIELVRRYLAAFGPATRADASTWSGLRSRDLGGALDALEPLRRFRDPEGRELLDLPRAPLPPAETRVPVRFLPKWDSVLLAHADRRRVVTDEHRRTIVGVNGDVAQTFLVDGLVAGTWTIERGRVLVHPFAPLSRAARRELEDEARRLEAFAR